MKNRLYSIMSDMEEITKQIEDMKNILETQIYFFYDEKQCAVFKSVLNTQIRLLKAIKEDCCKLYTKVDETILDIIHGRV